MTGNPSHDDAIISFVARVNLHHGGCTPQQAWKFIEGMGYIDPGRELRRLFDNGKLRRDDRNNEYYAPMTIRAQGLGRWI